jgi:3-oxoacyl-[acyl-carrier protein] reductase
MSVQADSLLASKISPRRPVALVTGGRRGIGLGVAVALADAGFDIAIADIQADSTPDQACEKIHEAGAAALFVQLDLADLDAHRRALARVEDALGAVDVLVNNAGIGAPVRGDMLQLSPENFDLVLGVNLRGTMFLTHEVVRRMLEKGANTGSRAVITITSVSAELASPERSEYCVSKAALSMWMKNLALRLAPTNIGVFEIRPGIIRSDMTAGVAEKYDRLIADGLVPQQRWGTPEDIGKMVAGLVSGSFGFASGTVLNVDGGLSIPRL